MLSNGAAVKVVPNDVVGTAFCTEGVPGNRLIVNVPIPKKSGIINSDQSKFIFLKIGRDNGTNANITTNKTNTTIS